MKALFAGFPPFAAHPENPSEAVCHILAEAGYPTAILPVSYGKVNRELDKAMKASKADAIVILALSPFAKQPTLERYAYNEMDSVQEDNEHVVKTKAKIEKDGPASRATDIDLAGINQLLSSEGYAAALGLDPGRFVANKAYYHALGKHVALLVHVPLDYDFPVKETAEIAKLIGKYLEGC